MTTSRARFARIRGGALAAITILAVVAACETRLPTSAEVQHMDAASAERATVGVMQPDTMMAYTIDGRAVSRAEALALPGEAIGSIAIVRASASNPHGILMITSKAREPYMASEADSTRVRATWRADNQAPKTLHLTTRDGAQAFTGLVYVDGVRSDIGVLKTLVPSGIDRIEVLKGPAAMSKYSDPAAKNGVIVITMKKQ
jgi:hypothetical protein